MICEKSLKCASSVFRYVAAIACLINTIFRDLHNNQIQLIDDGSFDGLSSLRTLNLGQNIIPDFPPVALPALETLNLADNRIEALGGFSFGKVIKDM